MFTDGIFIVPTTSNPLYCCFFPDELLLPLFDAVSISFTISELAELSEFEVVLEFPSSVAESPL